MSRNPNPIPYPGTPNTPAENCICHELPSNCHWLHRWASSSHCELHGPVVREADEMLAAVAPLLLETLLRARADPNAYPCDYWKSETFKNQIDHAADHLLSLKCKILGVSPDDGEPDLPHAITRLAIAAWIERNAK